MSSLIAAAASSLQNATVVCMDVDSTVLTSEGIDDLAAYLGVGDEVAVLTKRAMEGGVSFGWWTT